ncbi:MAG: GDSL-type esterase/lipase family protein, partial [Solirubrobacteraceae bacterium]
MEDIGGAHAGADSAPSTQNSHKRRRSTRLVVVWVGLIATLLATATASAAAGVSGFKASTKSVGSAGDEVAFNATVPQAATCTVTASPSYGGLPAPFPCGPGTTWPYVTVPPNIGSASTSYTYSLTIAYSGGGTEKASNTVTIIQSPAPATTYVALGDSYSAGEGNPAKSPKSWVNREGKPYEVINGCDRSAIAYPELLSKWLPKDSSIPSMRLRFLACSGATTEDIWDSNAVKTYGLKGANNLEWQQIQDTQDLKNARIVTVTVGGDDLDFAGILESCIIDKLTLCGTESSNGWVADLEQNIGRLKPLLRETYEEIEYAAPNAALYVVGYPDLFPGNPSLAHLTACELKTGVELSGVEYLIERQGELTQVVEEAAKEAGAHYVDPNYTDTKTRKYGFWGHDVCAANSWFNGIASIPAHYDLHPNKSGQKALAENVREAITADSSPTGKIRPTIIDLGTLGGQYSDATAISNAGQVVGDAETSSGESHAFSWTKAGGMVDLGTLGGTYSYATAVNASGEVVGDSTTGSGELRAFAWTQAGGMVDLGSLGGEQSRATAINESGQVVGDAETSSGESHAFSWTQAGGMVDLGTLGGQESDGNAVNSSGQVVGGTQTSTGEEAFSWTQPGGMISLGTLGQPGGEASAINDEGQIVGQAFTAAFVAHAFSWTEAGDMLDLGTLGGEESDARALNDLGQVVGDSETSSGASQAFSWTEAAGMVALGTFGGEDSHAAAVNDSGQVVGSAQLSSNAMHSRPRPLA